MKKHETRLCTADKPLEGPFVVTFVSIPVPTGGYKCQYEAPDIKQKVTVDIVGRGFFVAAGGKLAPANPLLVSGYVPDAE